MRARCEQRMRPSLTEMTTWTSAYLSSVPVRRASLFRAFSWERVSSLAQRRPCCLQACREQRRRDSSRNQNLGSSARRAPHLSPPGRSDRRADSDRVDASASCLGGYACVHGNTGRPEGIPAALELDAFPRVTVNDRGGVRQLAAKENGRQFRGESLRLSVGADYGDDASVRLEDERMVIRDGIGTVSGASVAEERRRDVSRDGYRLAARQTDRKASSLPGEGDGAPRPSAGLQIGIQRQRRPTADAGKAFRVRRLFPPDALLHRRAESE
jgi:hypothetical protein